MQQDEADERVGTRILEFPKQFIVNATGNRQQANCTEKVLENTRT